jgi:hypothetical protein
MKAKYIFLILFAGVICFKSQSQSIPYPFSPDWESTPAGHIATGLGLADINGDGWKDMIVANGNDIERQHLVVYYNNGDGTFPLLPDWQSDDIDYHGHLAVGDINKDGWIDVAASVYIGASGFGESGKVKVYYNEGGELEGTPSFESYSFYTFSCALGDADADGDLDLATTGGEPYSSLFDVGKIFYNRNGTFSENPGWESSIPFGSLDLEFGDLDKNGFPDLIFISEETPNYIFLADDNGNISDSPSWLSSESENYINSVDFGFIGEFKHPGIMMTGNSQLGGDGKVRLYTFPSGVPATSAASWMSDPFGYGSGIILSDINLDGLSDLIYGGWWLPVKIHLAQNSVFETVPVYTSSTNSVVEAIQIADLDRDGIEVTTVEFVISGNGHSLLYLEKQLVENILSVQMNGKDVNESFWCHVPNKNWISFNDNLQAGDTVSVQYEYSNAGDMVVTNWDSSEGNYIFYYDSSTGISTNVQSGNEFTVSIAPNPAREKLLLTIVATDQCSSQISIMDLPGKQTFISRNVLLKNGNIGLEFDINSLAPGVYNLVISAGKFREIRKIVKL